MAIVAVAFAGFGADVRCITEDRDAHDADLVLFSSYDLSRHSIIESVSGSTTVLGPGFRIDFVFVVFAFAIFALVVFDLEGAGAGLLCSLFDLR